MAPGCELGAPSGSPELWALPLQCKVLLPPQLCSNEEAGSLFLLFHPLEWVLAEYKHHKKGRNCLLALTLMRFIRFIC